MKLIWITPECPYPPNTGGRVGIWKRIQYISENNEVFFFGIIDNEKESVYENKIKEYCKEVSLYHRCNGVKTIISSLKYPFPAVSRWNEKLKKDLEKSYDRIDPDFIMIDLPQMLGTLPSNILESRKIILNQHNIEFQTLKSLADGIKNPIKRVVYNIVSKQMKQYERQIYLNDKIYLYTFVSTKDKQFFEETYNKSNTLLVPVGAEIKAVEKMNMDSHSIIFVAKMSYPANEEGALWLINEIIPRVKKAYQM